MRFPELHQKKNIVVFRSKRDAVYNEIKGAEQISESRKDLRGRQKSRRPCYVVFNEVREIAFTPPPPSDRVHEPLISSFALIKKRGRFLLLQFRGIWRTDQCLSKFNTLWRFFWQVCLGTRGKSIGDWVGCHNVQYRGEWGDVSSFLSCDLRHLHG